MLLETPRLVRALYQMVKDGSFREDLYYRINVVNLYLPPLRERKEDIPLLTNHFIEKFNLLGGRELIGVSQEALAVLMLYDWPGNVRELVMCQDELIQVDHLPKRVMPKNSEIQVVRRMTLKDAEKQAIIQTLERNNWKKVKSAKELGIDKNTLRRKILRLGIENKK